MIQRSGQPIHRDIALITEQRARQEARRWINHLPNQAHLVGRGQAERALDSTGADPLRAALAREWFTRVFEDETRNNSAKSTAKPPSPKPRTGHRAMCEQNLWMTVSIEAQVTDSGKVSVRQRLAREFTLGLRRYSIKAKLRHLGGDLEKVVGNFSLSVAGVEVSRESLAPAASGVLEIDLQETVEAIATALQKDGRALGVFIDEMQDLDDDLMAALISVQHYSQQTNLPYFVFGAGLPNLPATLTGARSYAERLFKYQNVDALSAATAGQALSEPAEMLGACFEQAALAMLVDASGGYPYFVQEYGRAVWDIAKDKIFTADDSAAAILLGRAHLDGGFYPARWDRATSSERLYLAAMAESMSQSSSVEVGSSDVAARLGSSLQTQSGMRAAVIGKGLVYAPERGKLAFTVPGMDAYIRRQS